MSDPEVTIRPVEPRDEAAIARLWQMLSDLHCELDARLPVPAAGAGQNYASRLIERRDDPFTRTFVAEVDGEVVGYILGAVLDLEPDLFQHVDTGFIADVFVAPAYRRQGIARRLVETLNAWFAEQGADHVELQVAVANPDAVGFWQAVGGSALTLRMRLPLNERGE